MQAKTTIHFMQMKRSCHVRAFYTNVIGITYEGESISHERRSILSMLEINIMNTSNFV